MKFLKTTLLLILSCVWLYSCGGDDTDPAIVTIEDFDLTIDENPNNGDVLGTVMASTDKGTLTYALSIPIFENAVSIDASTGELTVTDARFFDFEINPIITGTLRASGPGANATATLTITLNNVAESVMAEPFAITIDENPVTNASLGTVSATTDAGSITYSLINQAPAGAMNIDANTGELTVADASLFDFETNSSLSATYAATNGTVTQQSMIVVNLNDVDEQDANAFIFTIVTTSNDETLSIQFPQGANNNTPLDFTVDWAGQDQDVVDMFSDDRSHTFATPGTYTISVSGIIPGVNFFSSVYRDKTITIEQWGNIQWKSMESMFSSIGDLTVNAQDIPDLSAVTSLSNMFNNITINGSIPNIDQWNVSNVEQFFGTFRRTNFNQDINNWNMGNAISLSQMFMNCPDFNQPLNNWDVSKVTSMLGTFENAAAFNQDLNNWDVSSVTDMGVMFSGATNFNGNISAWDVSDVTNMFGMFQNATAFNQDLSAWDVANVTNMSSMFAFSSQFNAPIGNWNVSNVTTMGSMFSNSTQFNQTIGDWNTAKVTDMSAMFDGATAFDQPLANWDVSQVTKMSVMFRNTSFNQNIDNWNVGNVTQMTSMLSGATAFDQNLANWNLQSLTQASSMLNNSGLSIANYDATLQGWANNVMTASNISLGATGLQYSANGETARNTLINDKSWSFTGDSKQ